MKKKVIVTLGLGLLALGLAGCTQDKEVATIKDKSIKESEMYDLLVKEHGEEVLSTYLVENSLKNDFGSVVTEDKINKRFQDDVQSYGGEQQFSEMLSLYGMGTPEEYKEQIKQTMYLEEAAKQDLKIEDKDIEEKFKSSIKLNIIQSETEDSAKEVISKLDKGKSIEDASKSDSSFAFGEEWFSNEPEENMLSKEIVEQANKLKDGEYTKTPIVIDEGDGVKIYYIVKVEVNPALTDKKPTDFKDDMINEISIEKLNESGYVNELIKKSLENNKVSIKDEDLSNSLAKFDITFETKK